MSMRRTRRWKQAQPEGRPWRARAARYLLGFAAVIVMVVGWKAAMRWLARDTTLADRSGGNKADVPPPSEGTQDVDARAADPEPGPSPFPHVGVRPARTGTRWTTEDDAYLTAHMDEASEAIAPYLGRTPSAVSLRKAILRREGR